MTQPNNISSEERASRTNKLLLAGLFAALTAVCSWINIPLFFTPIPVNLALLGPYLAGLILGSKYGALSQIVYVLMGALGLPVFAGFTGGFGVITGPTGGFLVGYLLCSLLSGLPPRKSNTKRRILLMITALAACYTCGVTWFMILTHSTIWAALTACVIPFLPGDAVKIAVAALLVKHLPKALSV